MCFYIHPAHKEVKIADKDIVCYKSLIKEGNKILSPYIRFKYFDVISFKRKTTVTSSHFILEKISFYDKNSSMISQGIHSHVVIKHFGKQFGKLYLAIIPKGTEYYYNPQCEEYVSLKLIVYRYKRIKADYSKRNKISD